MMDRQNPPFNTGILFSTLLYFCDISPDKIQFQSSPKEPQQVEDGR